MSMIWLNDIVKDDFSICLFSHLDMHFSNIQTPRTEQKKSQIVVVYRSEEYGIFYSIYYGHVEYRMCRYI